MTGTEKCSVEEFDCEVAFPKCIPDSWVCDGMVECSNSTDESRVACSEYSYFMTLARDCTQFFLKGMAYKG